MAEGEGHLGWMEQQIARASGRVWRPNPEAPAYCLSCDQHYTAHDGAQGASEDLTDADLGACLL